MRVSPVVGGSLGFGGTGGVGGALYGPAGCGGVAGCPGCGAGALHCPGPPCQPGYGAGPPGPPQLPGPPGCCGLRRPKSSQAPVPISSSGINSFSPPNGKKPQPC